MIFRGQYPTEGFSSCNLRLACRKQPILAAKIRAFVSSFSLRLREFLNRHLLSFRRSEKFERLDRLHVILAHSVLLRAFSCCELPDLFGSGGRRKSLEKKAMLCIQCSSCNYESRPPRGAQKVLLCNVCIVLLNSF